MNVLIAGAGRVGLRTARVLEEEGHHVMLIERDPDMIDRAREQGYDVKEGDAAEDAVIESVDLEDIDVVAGLTGDLNANFAVCTVGNHYGSRTVMRIDDDYREEIYEKYSAEVDEVIYPERLGAAGAKTALLGGNFNVIADLTEQLQMLSVTVPADSPVVGAHVSDVDLAGEARIYAHGERGESMQVPLPGTEIAAGDRLAVIADTQSVDSVTEQLVGSAEP